MKAPISRNPQKVMARILDAAEGEFMQAGYEAASTNVITERFGGSKATLFRHFPTKQLLAEAVIRRIAGSWRERIAWTDNPGAEPSEWLTAFCRPVLDWILSSDVLFVGRLAIAEGHKLPQLRHIFAETASFPLERALVAKFEEWTDAGRLTCRDFEGDARRFLDMALSGAVSRALYGVPQMDSSQRESHIQGVVELFLNGRERPRGELASAVSQEGRGAKTEADDNRAPARP